MFRKHKKRQRRVRQMVGSPGNDRLALIFVTDGKQEVDEK